MTSTPPLTPACFRVAKTVEAAKEMYEKELSELVARGEATYVNAEHLLEYATSLSDALRKPLREVLFRLQLSIIEYMGGNTKTAGKYGWRPAVLVTYNEDLRKNTSTGLTYEEAIQKMERMVDIVMDTVMPDGEEEEEEEEKKDEEKSLRHVIRDAVYATSLLFLASDGAHEGVLMSPESVSQLLGEWQRGSVSDKLVSHILSQTGECVPISLSVWPRDFARDLSQHSKCTENLTKYAESVGLSGPKVFRCLPAVSPPVGEDDVEQEILHLVPSEKEWEAGWDFVPPYVGRCLQRQTYMTSTRDYFEMEHDVLPPDVVPLAAWYC